MSEISRSEKSARAAALERQLASGDNVSLEVIAELLASGDEDLALLASYLLAGHKEEAIARSANPSLLLAKRREIEAAGEIEAAAALALPAPKLGEPAASMTIVVHGAFAAGDSWWRPTGVFGRYLGGVTGDLYSGADFYRWSGGGFHPDRVKAARDLVEWAARHPARALDIVSHSHGGNICFLATQLGLEIRKLISLATPICLDYLPDMRQIGILHNVISLADIIQGPASYIGVSHRGDGRTLADSQRVINHLATLDPQGHAPSHSELHDPATWKVSGLETRLLGPGSLPPQKG